MFDIVRFVIQAILQFIISLRNIMIPGTELSLLGFLVAIMTIELIYGFVYHFFRIEKNIYNKKLTKQYFKIRKNIYKL